jgi:hypothetical protein
MIHARCVWVVIAYCYLALGLLSLHSYGYVPTNPSFSHAFARDMSLKIKKDDTKNVPLAKRGMFSAHSMYNSTTLRALTEFQVQLRRVLFAE